MSAFSGSSHIPIYADIIPGLIGPIGDTGPTGPIGVTGDSLPGRTGSTGQGIAFAYYHQSGISLEFFNGNQSYISFGGSPGVSFINGVPQSVIIARGLTNGSIGLAGHSVLYSYVDSFEASNKIIIQPYFSNFNKINDEISLKIRTLEPTGSGVESVSADASYIYITGRTYSFNPVGNTGEILYKKDGLMYAIDGSNYGASANLLNLAFSSERQAIHNNQTIGIPTYIFSNQNISGISGPSGFGFFSVDYGSFGINNNKYQLIEDPVISNVTLNLGRTGSDDLIFKFASVEYDRNSIFTPQIITDDSIGSCCFCESDTTEIGCIDYVNSSYCSNVGGSFSTTSCINRISNGDCYAEGACCVNGKCINASLTKCIEYNGTFFPGEVCSGEKTQNSYFTCPNTCPSSISTGRCCYRGYCFDLTNIECNSIPGASFTSGVSCISETSDPVCCNGLAGACCKKINDTYICEQKLPDECSAEGGIFHGIGTNCDEIECCGINFIQNYFNSNTSCRANTVQPCLPIGTKIGGGYLVGVIGMPSPCSSYGDPLTAYGQPLICRVLPRGNVNGNGGYLWNWKNCGGVNGGVLGSIGAAASEINNEYFIRTKSSDHIDLSYQNNAKNSCLVKHGTPYIQQTANDVVTVDGILTNIKWNNSIQYIGSPEYKESNGRFAYPVGGDVNLNYLIPESSEHSNLYRELASTYYGENSVHMLWALIVAPEDAYDGNVLTWGMSEGRANIGSFNPEPITTFAVDGLLSTRMFDDSSKNNPRLWFRGNGSSDLKAYDRFTFFNSTNISKRSNWNFSVVENTVETNIDLFAIKYSEMWENNNPNNSCTRQISILNQSQYKGYNDWYIPSIVELNYIHKNAIEINNQILLNGDSPIKIYTGSDINANKEYWSSTSVCWLKSWNESDHLDYSKYELGENVTPSFKNSKIRFTTTDYAGLNDKSAYELSLNVCAGEHMLSQQFGYVTLSPENDGLTQSRRRSSASARLRPVRRIPIIIGCASETNEAFLNEQYFSSCSSCPGICNQ